MLFISYYSVISLQKTFLDLISIMDLDTKYYVFRECFSSYLIYLMSTKLEMKQKFNCQIRYVGSMKQTIIKSEMFFLRYGLWKMGLNL